jgi:shikimate dehydrogenase
MTDRYAVFGNPIGHSKSPRIHALFAKQTGQDISYEAILATARLRRSGRHLHRRKGGPARGANVTVPFKEEAFRLATQRTARAEAAGAVNTLSFDAGTGSSATTPTAPDWCATSSTTSAAIRPAAASCCWAPAARRAA